MVLCGASTPERTRSVVVQDKVTIMVITLPCCNEAQCEVRNNNSLQLAAMVQNFPVNMWGNTEVD